MQRRFLLKILGVLAPTLALPATAATEPSGLPLGGAAPVGLPFGAAELPVAGRLTKDAPRSWTAPRAGYYQISLAVPINAGTDSIVQVIDAQTGEVIDTQMCLGDPTAQADVQSVCPIHSLRWSAQPPTLRATVEQRSGAARRYGHQSVPSDTVTVVEFTTEPLVQYLSGVALHPTA